MFYTGFCFFLFFCFCFSCGESDKFCVLWYLWDLDHYYRYKQNINEYIRIEVKSSSS